jgi:hypothetical protein
MRGVAVHEKRAGAPPPVPLAATQAVLPDEDGLHQLTAFAIEPLQSVVFSSYSTPSPPLAVQSSCSACPAGLTAA